MSTNASKNGYASKATLFEPRLKHEDMELVTGGVISVRGMSRTEWLNISRLDGGEYETALLVTCIVQPALSKNDVQKWMKAAPAVELQRVCQRIIDLSGLGEHAEMAAHKSVSDEPEPAV